MLKKIFYTIQNLFYSYTNLGVVKNLRIEEKQSIRLINMLGAIPIIIYFYFIYYGFERAYYFPVYMGIALVLAEMLGIYVNALGKYITAKLIIFCVNSFAVFFIYNSINIDYSTVCYFFPILMAYEITFDIKKEIKYFLITFLFTLVCIILFFVIPKGAFFFCILPPDLVKETIILNYTFPLIISAVFLILIIKTHSKTRDKLIIARKQSDNANKVKSQFLSNMSHELKTPINGILGLTNLLMHENLSAQAAEYVKALHYSSTQLSSLVSDILDFSTIESDNIIFEEKMFDLNKVCTHVFDLFKEQAHKKNIGCFFNKLPIQCNVTGDPTRLQQVLSNLISNAIKFTEVGGIVTFSCNIKDDVNNKINIEFIIKDTGIGIAPDHVDKIFEHFTQADYDINRKYEGTGLGLAIAQKLVILQGGTINVVSRLDEGSIFTVELPFYKPLITPAHLKQDDETSLKNMNVLVAEDNAINVLVLTKFLKKWDVNYQVARDGNEAYHLWSQHTFDVILMDLHMPNKDGKETTQLIRASTNEFINKIPIIALTADTSVKTRDDLLSNGFNHYLTKPFDPNTLFGLLKEYSLIA